MKRYEEKIRFLLLLTVLFSFCCCGKKGTDTDSNTVQSDTTILSDPFRTFTPDIYESIEHNDQYTEWHFGGLLVGSVYFEKILFPKQKDSLAYVYSGIFKGLAFDGMINVSKRLILPERSKNLEISIIYEYSPCFPKLKSGLTLKTSFFTHNTLVKEFSKKLPTTLEIDKISKKIVNEDISIIKYKYRVPENADNMEISLYTYKPEVLEDSRLEEGLLNPSVYVKDGKPDTVKFAIDYGFSYFSLNKFEVKVNHENIENYIYNHSNPFTDEEIETFSKQISDSLKIGGNVKIVGIGESVHGSSTFSGQESEIIKNLIANGFNRIGIEVDPLFGIKLNSYVNGNAGNLDTMLSWGTFNFLNNREFKELMGFIKMHNQTATGKISIFGFDGHLDNNMNEIEEFINAGTENADSLYWDYLQNFVKRYKDGYAFNEILFLKRDKIMSDNIMYIADRIDCGDRIALVAHLGHLSKRTFPESSAGGYLSKKYGDKYAVVGLFTGGGNFFSNHFQGFVNVRLTGEFPLSKPIGKSLEQLCLSIDKEQFYMNGVSSLEKLDKILYARSLGGRYDVMQFSPVDIRKEMDIVWFIKNSKSSEFFMKEEFSKK